MLDVNIEKILPVTEVRDSLNKIIDDVESTDELYVITKNGKPAAIVVGVHHLEKLTGISHTELMPDENPSSQAPADQAAASFSTATDDSAQQNSSTPPAAATTDDNTPAIAPSVIPAAATEPVQPLEIPVIPTTPPAPGFLAPQPAETPAPTPMNAAAPIAPAATADDIFGTADSNAFPDDDLFKPLDNSQPAAVADQIVAPSSNQPTQIPPVQNNTAQTPPPANPLQQ